MLPIVAAGYVALALVVVAVNITELPRIFEQIIGGAFGIREMADGFSGGISATMLNGPAPPLMPATPQAGPCGREPEPSGNQPFAEVVGEPG